MSRQDIDSPRRAIRKRNKPQKYGDFLELSPTKRRTVADSDTSEEEVNEEYELLKPSALFTSDDVEGQDMFKFKSRRTKLDLQNKVKSTISSPKSVLSPLRTPRKSFQRGSLASPLARNVEATPKHVKDILKKKIIKEIESDSAESDFSGSSSDFVPDESDNESEDSQSSVSEPETQPQPEKPRKSAGRAGTRSQADFVLAPDNYFMMNASKKIATSDHTLARLKNMSLAETEDANGYISEAHKAKVAELNQSYDHLFDKWLYALCENFNVILYGVGSKRSVLQKFQAEKLKNFPCVVINGFFPGLTLKSILESIVVDLLGNASVPSNAGDVANLIDTQLSEIGEDLFLIVHNIDGLMLRNGRSQGMLASLAAVPNVHLVATIDHINAPLLWDHTKLSKFKFTWWDATTLQPYVAETALAGGNGPGGAQRLAALAAVCRSLNDNARAIFRLLAAHRRDHKNYRGISFKELYSLCREQFLVSSELSLRAQLAEFLDHQLVRCSRSQLHGETLHLMLDDALLAQFLEEQDA